MEPTPRPTLRRTRPTAASVGGLLLTGLLTTGCATLANGRHQEVLVLSEPSGASIRLNGQDVGSTPTTVRMRRRGRALLVVDKAGYSPASIPVSRADSRWVFGNLIFLNPLAAQGMDSTAQWAASAAAWFVGSMTLDFLSGGAFKRPPVVTVTLTPVAPAGAVAAGTRATELCPPRTPPDCWPRGVPRDCPATC